VETVFIKDASILIVEDNLFTRTTIRDFLEVVGARISEAEDAMVALKMMEDNHYDVIISDIMMPKMTGIEFLRKIREIKPDQQVIMITSSSDIKYSIEAIKLNIYDYIIKPIDFNELLTSLETALARSRSTEHHADLENIVAEKEQQIEALFVDAIQSLINALEARDSYTKGHSQRVAQYTTCLVTELDADEDFIENIILAAQLHDIGKLGMSDFILTRAQKLSVNDKELTRKHPEAGYKILKPILPDYALFAVKHHHERWDGDGYPDGLSGEDIPPGARIIAIADSYDAMTSSRIYRKVLTEEEALEELLRCSGTQFDPGLVQQFIDCIQTPKLSS